MTNIDNLPKELIETGLFCCWKYEDNKGRKTKIPYNPYTNKRADSSDLNTFAPFTVALETLNQSNGFYNGLGMGIFKGLCAVDIDSCINDNGEIETLALDVIETMDSYTERSPSGKGIRILFKTPNFDLSAEQYKKKYYVNNQKIRLEIYVQGITNRYVTVTGDILTPEQLPLPIEERSKQLPIEERTAQLQIILDKYMLRNAPGAIPTVGAGVALSDAQIISKAEQTNLKFKALWAGNWQGYASQSEAVLALCNMLAFWTGRDAGRMDNLFRQSGLMNEKWDRRESGTTRGALEIKKAIEGCTAVYNPQEYYKDAQSTPTVATGTSKQRLTDMRPESNPRYTWDDMGNGYLFADWYKDEARFVTLRNKWFIYNGKIWVPDESNLRAAELCKKLAKQLTKYAWTLQDEKMQQNYLKFLIKWQGRNYRETILKDAQSVYPMAVTDFDANPYLLNCLNGTLDLETKIFYKHNPNDFLSKMSGVNFDSTAKSNRWEQFIDEVMMGDKDKAEFLQKALGYALTGDTKQECFFVLYGPTSRNGKGTTMETFMQMMGHYGKTGRPDSLAQRNKPNANGPTEDIARLAGARFVNFAEPDKTLVLSAALVKSLTGNDTQTARYLNENSFEYKPQFKLFINTNHLPAVTDNTLFTSGRVKIIQFERHFEEWEQDKGLKDELTKPENLSGILNWCIEGLRMIETTGFNMPDTVKSATDEYRKDNDRLGRFIEDEMERDSDAETPTVDVYNQYIIWCSRNGFTPDNQTTFNSSLKTIATITRKRPAGSSRNVNPVTLMLGYKFRTNNIKLIAIADKYPTAANNV